MELASIKEAYSFTFVATIIVWQTGSLVLAIFSTLYMDYLYFY